VLDETTGQLVRQPPPQPKEEKMFARLFKWGNATATAPESTDEEEEERLLINTWNKIMKEVGKRKWVTAAQIQALRVQYTGD